MSPPRTLLVALEARLVRAPDGRICSTTGVEGYAFWQRYLEVFDTVIVAARTEDSATCDPAPGAADGRVRDATRALVAVEGAGVRVLPLPAYDGPWGYAAVRRRLAVALRAGIAQADALCLRAPGAIAGLAWRLRGSRPVAIEVVGDPHEALARGVVRSSLRPLARLMLARDLRAMCAGAVGVAYVSREQLPERYPAAAWHTSYSSVELDDDAFAGPATRAARATRQHERDVTGEPWHLVFVGSLAQRYKGPDVLIEAVARCRAAGLSLAVTIVGDGRHRAALAAEAAAHGLGDAIRFTGHVAAGQAVRDILDSADLFVLPSRTEGLPRALLEAMARGVPGVGSRIGGIPELLPEERLVPPGDAGALAAVLLRVLGDREALANAAKRDHEVAREYHVTRLRPRRRELYERLHVAADAARDAAPHAPSARAPSMTRNAAWALVGNLGYAACQWAVLIAIAKLASATDVGRFALGLALTAPAMMLANLHLRAIQATDARGAHPFRVYMRLRLVTTMVAYAAIALVTAALGYRGADLAIVLAVAAAKAVESLSDVTFGLLQQAERLRRIACSMLVKGALSVAAVAVALTLGGGVLAASVALAIAWAAVFLVGDLRAALRLAPVRGPVSGHALGALTRLALPMGCVMALNSLTANVPRYEIAASLGPAGLGHFAALVALLLATTQPLLAVGAAVSPRMARHFVDDPVAYRGMMFRLLAVAALLGVGAIAGALGGGRRVLTLAYAPEYAAHAPVLVILAISAAIGFLGTAFGVAVTAARRFTSQLAIAVAALTVCAVASRIMVPLLGLRGAALAMLACETTRCLSLATVYVLFCAPRRQHAGGEDPAATSAIRILHVFGTMDRGGAETRTLEVMRRLDRCRYRFDFCVLSGVPGAYGDEIVRLGGQVVACALRPRLVTFALRFATLLRARRYDVVHSHVHQFSGATLLIAHLCGVRTRIAHIRSTSDGQPTSAARWAYRRAMRWLLERTATTVIGVSEGTMEALLGTGWRADDRHRVIYDGIEEERFIARNDGASVRHELGIAPDTRVLVHVGNFTPAKNHASLIAIAAATIARRRDVMFVLVGDGPLRPRIEAEIARRELAPWFRCVGLRDDVPRLLAAADLCLLPSSWEGLPGAVLEALATGVPVVASSIPGVLEIARHASLSVVDASRAPASLLTTADPAQPAAFADVIVARLGAHAQYVPTRGALPRAFTVEASMEQLLACYGSRATRAARVGTSRRSAATRTGERTRGAA